MSPYVDANVALGLLTILAPIAILVAALILVLRLVVAGELRRGILYVVFLPERQQILIRWFVVMVLFFIAGTVLDGLALLFLVPQFIDGLGGAVADIGAATALLVLLEKGLSPRPLTESEKNALSSQPLLLAALGISPE
jgi:hypothetical protein